MLRYRSRPVCQKSPKNDVVQQIIAQTVTVKKTVHYRDPIGVTRQNRRYATLSALIGLFIASGLLAFPLWQPVEERVFDHLTMATPGTPQLPITIVAIDEASFTQLGIRWPWPRDMHAKLIRALSKGGAGVIAFDVMFSEPGPAAEDAVLAKAIAEAGNVVFAADHAYQETASVRQWMRMDPIPLFTLAG